MRKNIRALIFFLSLTVLTGLYGLAQAQVTMDHEAFLRVSPGQTLDFYLSINPMEGNSPLFYWKTTGSPVYRTLSMSQSQGVFVAELKLPKEAVGMLSYYFEDNYKGGKSTLPQKNAATAPFTARIEKDTQGPSVTLLSPEDGSKTSEKKPVITITLDDDLSGVDTSTITVSLDGKNITAAGTTADTLFSYSPSEDIKEGAHKLSVVAKDLAGNQSSREFSFTISSTASVQSAPEQGQQQSKPGDFAGTISEEVQYVGLGQQPANTNFIAQIPGFTNRFGLNAAGRSMGQDIVLSIRATNEDIPSRQMVDRFTLSMGDGHYKLTGGDFGASFSELSLYNFPEIRGANLSFTSGDASDTYSRLTVLGGMTKRAIEGTAPAFGQYLYGTRYEIGFLSGSNIGFNYLSINDDFGSISQPGFVIPQSNHVFSADTKVKIIPWFLTLGGEVAASVFNYDQTVLGLTGGEASRYFVSFDMQSNHLGFNYKDTGGQLPFLGSGFATLGNPYLVTDYKGWNLNGRTAVMNDKLSFSGRFETYSDDNTGLKLAKTTTNNFNIATGYQEAAMASTTLGYTRQTQADDGPDRVLLAKHLVSNQSDTVSIDQTMGLLLGKTTSSFGTDLSYSNFMDDVYSNNFNSLTFMLTNSTVFDNPWSLLAGAGITTNNMTLTSNNTNVYILNTRVGYQFVPQKINSSLGVDVLNTKDSSGFQNNTRSNVNILTTCNQLFIPRDAATFTVGSTFFNDAIVSASSYSTYLANLRYAISF